MFGSLDPKYDDILTHNDNRIFLSRQSYTKRIKYEDQITIVVQKKGRCNL